MSDATPSDIDLLSRAREGDSSAAAELYVRHSAAARRLASTYPRAGDPDDLVNEAFERVLGALGRGSGPDQAFRAYLFVTLRRIAAEQAARTQAEPIAEVPDPVEARAQAHGPAFDPADRQIVLSAYQSLPDRQQVVLWHTAVEGRPPRDLVPILGVSANAVAALASRARERLREAYLQAHLQTSAPPECEPHRSRLGAFVRDGLSNRDKSATETHVSGCNSCRNLVNELADVNQLLVPALHPLFVAAAQVGALAAGGATGGGVAATGLAAGRRALSKARSNPVTVGAIVAAAAVVAALIALIGDDRPVPDLSAPPAEAEAPSPDAPAAPDRPAPEPPLTTAVEPPPPTTTAPATPATPATRARAAAEPPPPPPDEQPPTTAAPTTPPPTSLPPPTTAPPAPAEPELGPVVWLADSDVLQITLANGGEQPTDYLATGVTLNGGAVVDGWPTGCQIALPLVWAAGCGVPPLDPGESAVVRVPVAVTGPGQTARVSLCEVGLLTADCTSDILQTTTTALTD